MIKVIKEHVLFNKNQKKLMKNLHFLYAVMQKENFKGNRQRASYETRSMKRMKTRTKFAKSLSNLV